MGTLEHNDPFSRGTKRKHAGDPAPLTFAQRLAAARKAPRRAESETDEPASEPDLPAAESLGPEALLKSSDIEQDERFRSLYAQDVDFGALADKDDEFGPQ
jgi:hypothetical protein